MSDFQDKSYFAHAEHLKNILEQEGAKSPFFGLRNKGSVNYWRHLRMYSVLDPFILDKNATWLTVGDGCGWDANYLHELPRSVHASDLGAAVLQQAAQLGFIGAFSSQNAEKLSFADDSFDYVFCKEAYHHFPRPYLAVYEMLRVARRGIIFMEPQDPLIKIPVLLALKNIFDRIGGPHAINKIWKNRFSFETVGNYVYKISDREIEKIAMGINLPAIAFWGLNDTFESSEKISQNTPDPAYFQKIKLKIGFRDFLSNLGVIPYKQLGCVLFKKLPSAESREAMQKKGFKYLELPKNPYI